VSTKLLLPTGAVPSNLHFPEDVDVQYVDSDMYGISERVSEISPDLHIWQLSKDSPESEGGKLSYMVTESCVDGVERLVFKVKELDARVLHKLSELFAVPLQERYEKLAAENYRYEQKAKEDQADELYERLGRPMWTQMEHDGFIGPRNVSYPKLGVISGGSRAR
jgi:hypothetical protein